MFQSGAVATTDQTILNQQPWEDLFRNSIDDQLSFRLLTQHLNALPDEDQRVFYLYFLHGKEKLKPILTSSVQLGIHAYFDFPEDSFKITVLNYLMALATTEKQVDHCKPTDYEELITALHAPKLSRDNNVDVRKYFKACLLYIFYGQDFFIDLANHQDCNGIIKMLSILLNENHAQHLFSLVRNESLSGEENENFAVLPRHFDGSLPDNVVEAHAVVTYAFPLDKIFTIQDCVNHLRDYFENVKNLEERKNFFVCYISKLKSRKLCHALSNLEIFGEYFFSNNVSDEIKIMLACLPDVSLELTMQYAQSYIRGLIKLLDSSRIIGIPAEDWLPETIFFMTLTKLCVFGNYYSNKLYAEFYQKALTLFSGDALLCCLIRCLYPLLLMIQDDFQPNSKIESLSNLVRPVIDSVVMSDQFDVQIFLNRLGEHAFLVFIEDYLSERFLHAVEKLSDRSAIKNALVSALEKTPYISFVLFERLMSLINLDDDRVIQNLYKTAYYQYFPVNSGIAAHIQARKYKLKIFFDKILDEHHITSKSQMIVRAYAFLFDKYFELLSTSIKQIMFFLALLASGSHHRHSLNPIFSIFKPCIKQDFFSSLIDSMQLPTIYFVLNILRIENDVSQEDRLLFESLKKKLYDVFSTTIKNMETNETMVMFLTESKNRAVTYEDREAEFLEQRDKIAKCISSSSNLRDNIMKDVLTELDNNQYTHPQVANMYMQKNNSAVVIKFYVGVLQKLNHWVICLKTSYNEERSSWKLQSHSKLSVLKNLFLWFLKDLGSFFAYPQNFRNVALVLEKLIEAPLPSLTIEPSAPLAENILDAYPQGCLPDNASVLLFGSPKNDQFKGGESSQNVSSAKKGG